MVSIMESLIVIGTGLFTAALIPQLIRTLKLGHANDFSLSFIVLVWFASLFTMIYWIDKGEWVAAFGFLANILVWSVVGIYKVRPRDGHETSN